MILNEPTPRQKKKLVKLLNKMYPETEIIDFSFTYRTYGDEPCNNDNCDCESESECTNPNKEE